MCVRMKKIIVGEAENIPKLELNKEVRFDASISNRGRSFGVVLLELLKMRQKDTVFVSGTGQVVVVGIVPS